MHFIRTLLPIVSLVSLAASSPLQHVKRVESATISMQLSATSTTSSSIPCPTTPEQGTYCGFINPEDPCAPQPGGQGPTMVPDTVNTFINYIPFQSISLNNTYTPGYTNIFKNLTSAAKNNDDYIGLYYLDTYDVAACAAKCNQVSTCNSFNIYIERDPSVNPTKNDSTAPTVWGYWCPNPPSLTNYKCALWGNGIYNSSATNHGQHRGDFEGVVAGSNAFVKNGVYNSTTYSSGSGVVPTIGMPAPTTGMPAPTPSAIVAYTGAASAYAVSSVLGACAISLAMSMVL